MFDALTFIVTFVLFLFFYFIVDFWKQKRISHNNYSINTSGYIPIDRREYPFDNLSYEDLLNTYEWKTKRQEIMFQHNYKCDWCGSSENLEIHHKKYLKYPNGKHVLPWKYDDRDYMCLCSKCHKKYHEKYKVKTYHTKID